MTRKLEELLGLPRLDEAIKELERQKEQDPDPDPEIDEVPVVSYSTPAPTGDPPDQSLMALEATTITPAQMASHDRDMDEIADRAMETFEELKGLGFGVEAKSAGPIFEPMVNVLKLAMDAKSSKIGQKMKYMRLQLERERLEHQKAQKPTEGFVEADTEAGVMLDRNAILAHLGGPAKSDK